MRFPRSARSRTTTIDPGSHLTARQQSIFQAEVVLKKFRRRRRRNALLWTRDRHFRDTWNVDDSSAGDRRDVAVETESRRASGSRTLSHAEGFAVLHWRLVC
ncbi:hypothetical protein MTP99_012018 [Tenebrio molitor]|nr:hypothetical protein MTP99_012018 [Tenebrio molitor]